MNPKVFVATVAIGGGCIGLPLLLLGENIYGASSQKPQSSKTVSMQVITAENKSKVTKELPTAKGASVGVGNCEIQKMSDDSIDFLLKRENEGKLYVELLCGKDETDTGSGSWPHMWTGLIPETLFADDFTLEVDKKFNLKTKTVTETDGEQEKTTFQSSALKSPFEGIWGTKLKNRRKETVTTISVSSDQEHKIYILSN